MSKHQPTRRIQLFWVTAALALVSVARPAQAAEPGQRLEVHDVSLWVIDPGAKVANARTAHPSALPVTINSVRSGNASRTSRRVAPINLLTFQGPATDNLDVDLRTSEGAFLAHWPPGDSLPNRLRWSGTPAYNLVEKLADESELMFVDSDSWFNKARQSDALYVKRGVRAERFLAYDVELKLDAPVRLEGGPDSYRVINTSDRALHDVMVARHTPQGVRLAWIDVLPAGKSAAPKSEPAKPKKVEAPNADPFAPRPVALPGGAAAQPLAVPPAGAAAPQPKAQAQLVKAKALVELAKAKAAAAAAQENKKAAAKDGVLVVDGPAEVAAAKPAASKKPAGGLFGGLPATKKPAGGGLFGSLPGSKSAAGVEVTLDEPIAVDSPTAAAHTTQALSQRLSKAGLTDQEVELFVDHYGSLFFQSEALVVACRLDPAAIEETISLSIFPAPAKTVRVAMVLVRNADPQLGNEVVRLVAQLGDPSFAVREAAQQRLMELGPLAFGPLNNVLTHTDPEIVIRAERILLNQKQTPKPGAAVQGGGGQIIRAAPVIINR